MLNVIAGNDGEGVMIENDQGDALPDVPSQVTNAFAEAGYSVDASPDGATANRVQGNWIGFDSNGELELLPNTDGVFIASSGNTIGGTTAAAQNIIIANDRDGVVVSGDRLDSGNNSLGTIRNAEPVLNVIAGNFIGTQGGADSYGNTLDGVFLDGATGNTIGGSASGSLNVISGNNVGIAIESGGANVVIGNDVGTTSDGSQPLPNATDGIAIAASSANTIGGTVPGDGNVISGNKVGVHITESGSSGNVLWGNLIGTDAQGTDPVRNTSDGVLIDAGASNNTIGGTGSGRGEHHRLQHRRRRPGGLRQWRGDPHERHLLQRPDRDRPGRRGQRFHPAPDAHCRTPRHLPQLDRHPGDLYRPTELDVPDPVLQQHRGRPVGQLRGPDLHRLDDAEDQRERSDRRRPDRHLLGGPRHGRRSGLLDHRDRDLPLPPARPVGLHGRRHVAVLRRI